MNANARTEDVKFVYFDLDDTLVDTTSTVAAAFGVVLEDLRARVAAAGYEAPPADVDHTLIRTFGSTLAREYFGAWLYQAGVADGLRRRLAADAIKTFRREIEVIPPFPEAEPLLAWLAARRIGLGIITDGLTARQHQKLANAALARWVGPVFISGDYPPFSGKPAQAMFEDALAAAALPPAAVMFVGDANKDVIGANLAGMISVRVRQGWARREEPPPGLAAAVPAYAVDNLAEIKGIIAPAEEGR